MKKPVPKISEWNSLLAELADPETKNQVDVPTLLAWLEDERAKAYRTYTRNALAYCVSKFMDVPDLPQNQQDFYRGAAMAYRSLMNLKTTLKLQSSGQEATKKQATTVGSAGY
jgi:hypothetical protein